MWANNDHRLWSMYRFLMQIHKCKEDYYLKGKSSMTDYQYDSLERSFEVLHGKKRLSIYSPLGYTKGSYKKFKKKFNSINKG